MLLRETAGIFLQNFSFIQRGLKWKKRDFNTFEVVQYAILRVRSNRFPRIIAQMTGFTKRNNWNFFQNFSRIPSSRNVAGSEKNAIPYIWKCVQTGDLVTPGRVNWRKDDSIDRSHYKEHLVYFSEFFVHTILQK